MYKILAKQDLAPQIKLFKIHATDVAEKAKPGQFVILRVDEKGERIPLTLVDWLIAIGIGLVPLLLLELYIAFVRRRCQSF